MRKTIAIWLAKGMKTSEIYEVRRTMMQIADHKLEDKFGLVKPNLAK